MGLFFVFLNSEEPFLQLNTNFLETNVVNILLLVGLLVYGYKVSFSVSLDQRQKDIIQTIDTEMNKMLILTSLLNCRLAIAQKYIFIINIKIMP